MCFIEDLCIIAMCQDNKVEGYVRDDSVEILADVIEETIAATFEIEEGLPTWIEWWTLSTPEGYQHKIVGALGDSVALPNHLVPRIISRLGVRSDGTQLKWSQRFVKGEKNSIQIRTIHEFDAPILNVWQQCEELVTPIVLEDSELLRNEVPMGSHEHIRSYVDVYIHPEWRAFFVGGHITYKEEEGCPPITSESWWPDFVAGKPAKASGGRITVKWANPDAEPFKFEDLPWYQDMIRRH